jgi:arylsulfatase A-like enzyme
MEHVDVIRVANPIPDSRGIRTEEWKYIRYLNVTPEVEELYHLKSDPLECENLISDPDYQTIADQIRNTYAGYLDQFQQR